ncbi:MAG: hypothetical protein JW729_05990 [Bacteroidales bacterium]|nr:hypothetical protein [Bacteroidales bacterium]
MNRLLFIFLAIMPLLGQAQEKNNLFFVFLNTNPDKEVLDSCRIAELQTQHLANIERLYQEGKIIAAGPFYSGGGLFVFKEQSLLAVEKLVQTDPAIAANRFKLEIYPLEISSGKIAPYMEPLEMTTLVFIRISENAKIKAQKQLKELHRRFGKQILFSAYFRNEKGGFVVLDADFKTVNEELDKGENSRTKTLIVKQLYIAKGTFVSEQKK